ncbi:MAG: class I SAM-dependent rRNA methyltransferase [Spirochaetes bacterium]|nr:class I SAM-dependent rRNA methyltransferase [Spirochaetota bacterium]
MERLRTLLATALEKRHLLYENPSTNCFRLFNGDGDGLGGLTLDWYGGYLLVQYFDDALDGITDEITALIDSNAAAFPALPRGVLLKKRPGPGTGGVAIAAAAKSVLLSGEAPPRDFYVKQNGVRAAVDLMEGQNTGVFLDMRGVRDRLEGYYTPRDRMLNLFCYTALFSVHALMCGSGGAVNVDLSKGVLARARANYVLNGLRVDDRDFVYGDSLDWIRRFQKKGTRFSFVLFDPPTFSRNRRRTFSVKRHYASALGILAGIVGPGWVLTSINSPSISLDEYRGFHPGGWKCEFVEHEPLDFPTPGPPYLKAGLWRLP